MWWSSNSIFSSVYVVDYIYWFAYIKATLYLSDEANLNIKDNLLDVFLNSVCEYFIVNCCIYVHKESVYKFPFFWVFMWFGITAPIEFENITSDSIFHNYFRNSNIFQFYFIFKVLK